MSIIYGFIRKYPFVFFLLLVAAFIHLGSILPYSFEQCRNNICGIFYPHAYAAHDDSWTMSIATTAFRSYPPVMPLFAGASLRSYHFLAAFVLWILSFITRLPLITVTYAIVPIFWFVLLSILTVLLGLRINKSGVFLFFLVLFVFFGGSFSYLFAVYHHLPLFFSGVMTGRQSIGYLTSFPLAISLVPFVYILYAVFSYEKMKKKGFILLCVSLFLTWGGKFYGGLLASIFIFTYAALLFFKTKKLLYFKQLLLTFAVTVVAVLFFYNPFSNTGATKHMFVFSPFATVHSMIEKKNLFYIPNMVLARYTLAAHGWGPRLIFIELFSLLLFIVHTFGTRIIGILYILNRLRHKTISRFEIALCVMIGSGIVASTLFIQSVEWWNITQFLDYSRIGMGILAALYLNDLLVHQKRIVVMCVSLIVVIATVHNALEDFMGKVFFPAQVVITKNELRALSVLKNRPDGIIFSLPYDGRQCSGIQLCRQFDTVYVPVYTGKQVYYSTPYILDLTGIQRKDRAGYISRMIPENLEKIPAKYYYLIKSNPLYPQLKINRKQLITIYQNSDIEVLEKR